MSNKGLSLKEKYSYGIGAVGKDMCCGIIFTYCMLYFTDVLRLLNNPVPVSLLSGDRKPQIRFLGNHHSGSGNLYHKSFRM